MADVILITIDGNATGVVGAVGQTEAALGRLEGSASKAGSTLQTAMGVAAVAGVAALGAGLASVVSSAAGFEKQMSAVGAVAGATASEMESLTKMALQLGKDTSFSAKEAAVGIEELVKAGVSVADAMGGGARAALDLAAAGAISVGDAAEIASNAMNVFGLKGADMAHVADVIAGAANASAISVNDYKFSLSAAGAVAATVGIGFEDLSTAIAVMGQAGIKGSDAGTSLKTMLLNLQPSTKAQTAEFTRLGIVTADGANAFFTAEGKAKSMAEIAQVLQDKMKGMTDQQKLASLEILFGSDAIRAGAVLLKAGAAGFEDMATAMGKVTAQKVAEERLNNLFGSVEKLKGSLETGAIILGGMFTPALKTLTDMVTGQVNDAINILEQIPDVIGTIGAVLNGDWAPDSSIHPFTNAVGIAAVTLNQQFGPAIKAVGGFIKDPLLPAIQAILAPLGAGTAAFLGVVGVAGLVSAAVAVVTTVLGLLLSPLGLVALAAAALAAAWTVNFGDIQGKTLAFVGIVQQALSGDVSGAITALTGLIGTTTAEIATQLTAWGTAFVTWIQVAGPPMLAAATLIGAELLTWIGTNGPLIAAQLLTWGLEFAAWVAPAIPPLIAAVTDLGAQFLTWVAAQIPPIVAQLALWGAEFVAWVAPQIPPLLATLGALATGVLGWLGEQIPPIIAQLVLWGAEFIAWVAPQIPPLLAALAGLYVQVQDWLIAQIPGVTAELVKWGVLFGAWVLGSAIPELVKALPGIVTEIDKWAIATALAIPPLLLAVGKGLVEGIYNGFMEAWKTIGPKIMEQISSIKLPSWLGGGGGAPGLQTQSSVTGGGSAHVSQYIPLINKVAAETGVPADVLAALMEVEGSPANSTSQAGARGLMQVMPNYVRPGEDPFDPLTSIRQGARAVTEKYNATGSWQGAGRAYFGYGVDAGGMDTNTYGGRYDAARQRYQQQTMSDPNMMQRMPLGMGMPGGLPGADPSHWPTMIQQVIDVAPDWQTAMAQIQQSGVTTFTAVGDAGLAAGTALVSTSTDSLGNLTTIYSDATGVIGATITDAAGVVVNAWGTMATTVPAQTETMAQTALTSVTNLGTGLLTTFQDSSGTTIATVTDMAGNVTSQYATLGNGVQLSMGDMAGGVLTSTTDLGTGVMTTVQDMSGNYITTITDLSGNVTAQYTQLGTNVAAQTATMSTAVTAETGTMATDVLTSVTDLGDGVLTVVQDMSGNTTATITDLSGNVTSEISTMSGEVVTSAQTMGTDVVTAAGEMQTGVVDAATTMQADTGAAAADLAADMGDSFGTVVDLAGEVVTDLEAVGEVEIPAPDVSDVLDSMKDIEDAAKDAADAIKDINSATKGGSKGGGSGLGKAAGGPVAGGVGYIVGENGPEFFMPAVDGTIIPNHRIRGFRALGGPVSASNPYSPVGTTMDGISGEFGRYIVEDIVRMTNDRAEQLIAETTRLHEDLVDLTLGTAVNFETLAKTISGESAALLLGVHAVDLAVAAGAAAVVSGATLVTKSVDAVGVIEARTAAEVSKIPPLLTQINTSIGKISVGTPKPTPAPKPTPTPVIADPIRTVPVPVHTGPRIPTPTPISTPVPTPGRPRPITPPMPIGTGVPPPVGVRAVGTASVSRTAQDIATAPFARVIDSAAQMYQQVAGSTANMKTVSATNVDQMATSVTASSETMSDDVGSIFTGLQDDEFDSFIRKAGEVDTALATMATNGSASVDRMGLSIVGDFQDMTLDVVGFMKAMKDDVVDLFQDLRLGALDEIDLMGDEIDGAIFLVQGVAVAQTDILVNAVVSKIGTVKAGAVGQIRTMGADMAAEINSITTTTGSGPIKNAYELGEAITKDIGKAISDKRKSNIVEKLVDAVVDAVKDARKAAEKEADRGSRSSSSVLSLAALGRSDRGFGGRDGPGATEIIAVLERVERAIAAARSIEVSYGSSPPASLVHDVAVLESLSRSGT